MVGGGFPRRSVTKSSPLGVGYFLVGGAGGHIPRSFSPPRGEDFRGGGFRGTPAHLLHFLIIYGDYGR